MSTNTSKVSNPSPASGTSAPAEHNTSASADRDRSAQAGPLAQSVARSTRRYLRQIDQLDLEQLRRVPAEDEWSLGQMYMHLAGSALHMQLANAKRCLEAAASGKPSQPLLKTPLGEALFEAGSFPPERVKVPPSPQYTPAQPESKEQLRSALQQVVACVSEMEASAIADRSGHTQAHPRFGNLTASEWVTVTEMHYRHHFLQEERLLKELGLATAPAN
ncbi:DinB family protein [Saccharibacillus sacchari]|uniref:DinB family protein n=1 Tax=Saccharibacillus sacchari TaxID=456493 RepID=A0ACC6PFA5_9BACL